FEEIVVNSDGLDAEYVRPDIRKFVLRFRLRGHELGGKLGAGIMGFRDRLALRIFRARLRYGRGLPRQRITLTLKRIRWKRNSAELFTLMKFFPIDGDARLPKPSNGVKKKRDVALHIFRVRQGSQNRPASRAPARTFPRKCR